MKESENQIDSGWQATPFANLVRYKSSGTYFARLKVQGKLIRRSLKTNVLSVAKLRLTDMERQERERASSQQSLHKGKMTFGQAVEVYRDRLNGDASLKPRTKDYHEERIAKILKSWPGLNKLPIQDISKTECITWAARFGRELSASAFNHSLGILRKIVEIGIEFGVRYDNPARFIKRMTERAKRLHLPAANQFEPFVTAIETAGSGFSKPCAELVRFLAFGGFRIMEARNVTWADCDFDKGEITVLGDPETGTKGEGTARKVPMIAEMKSLLERLREKRADEPPTTAVMRVRECQKAMDRAARVVGMKRITHHDLRHLFATRCIESGVDIPTVSRWLGHKDGGALAMRVYGHLRDQHSTDMARRVSFSNSAVENVLPMPKEGVAWQSQ